MSVEKGGHRDQGMGDQRNQRDHRVGDQGDEGVRTGVLRDNSMVGQRNGCEKSKWVNKKEVEQRNGGCEKPNSEHSGKKCQMAKHK